MRRQSANSVRFACNARAAIERTTVIRAKSRLYSLSPLGRPLAKSTKYAFSGAGRLYFHPGDNSG